MDQQTCVYHLVLHRFQNFIERRHYCLEVRLMQFKRQVRRRFQSRNRDALSGNFTCLHRVVRNYYWPVVLAKTRTAIEQHVFVAQPWVCREAQCRHIVFFRQRRFVQGLNIVEHVRVLVSGRVQLVRRQCVEHERIIGVWRMREFDFSRFRGRL